jgi:FAD:protein FMN transferase
VARAAAPVAPVLLACQAMATRFELLLAGGSSARLRAAGEEALATIRRVEDQLSFYSPRSELARVNAAAAEARPVHVSPELFAILERARRLHAATHGMFDVTVGPLMRVWRFAGGSGSVPGEAELHAALIRVGMHLLELDAATRTVSFRRPGVEIDLGGVGKGYALDQAAEVLREAGVERALLHGGTSSVVALGEPTAGMPWQVAVRGPGATAPAAPEGILGTVQLRDRALSVSAVWGRAFRSGDEVLGHVMDPRRGRPVAAALLAAVTGPSAADADALSTGLLGLGSRRAGAALAAGGADEGLLVERDPAPPGYSTWTSGSGFFAAESIRPLRVRARARQHGCT